MCFCRDVRKIQEAIGVKLCLFIYYGNNSLICLGIALFHGWVLVLVALTAFPISILIALVFHAIVTRFAVKTQAQFSKSGSIVQQTVTNIKTVMAFNGQGKQAAKYSSALAAIRGVQSKQAVITGIGLGLSHGLKHCSYALAIWYAATLYFDEVSKICKTEPTYGVSTLMIVSKLLCRPPQFKHTCWLRGFYFWTDLLLCFGFPTKFDQLLGPCRDLFEWAWGCKRNFCGD